MSVVYGALDTSKGDLLILNGAGDTGKSWLLNEILEEVYIRGDISIEVAGIGKDACLYDGGRKARIPLSLANMGGIA